MDKRNYRQLAQASITDATLDVKKVERIAGLLSNAELKEYIKALKQWVNEHTVTIEVPNEKNVPVKNMESVFTDKTVVIKENPSLLLGMRIKDNDDVYEMSLANTLSQIERHVLEGYDR